MFEGAPRLPYLAWILAFAGVKTREVIFVPMTARVPESIPDQSPGRAFVPVTLTKPIPLSLNSYDRALEFTLRNTGVRIEVLPSRLPIVVGAQKARHRRTWNRIRNN